MRTTFSRSLRARRLVGGLTLALSLFCFARFLFAAGDDIKVKAEVDRAFLTIGDLVTYTVMIEHAPDIQVLSSIPAPDSEFLEIKKVEDLHEKRKKTEFTGRKFVLTTYRLGEFSIDPVTIQYRKNGQPDKNIQTQKI